MPELPEVETVVRTLEKQIKDEEILDVLEGLDPDTEDSYAELVNDGANIEEYASVYEALAYGF